jgi:hypothetical protein
MRIIHGRIAVSTGPSGPFVFGPETVENGDLVVFTTQGGVTIEGSLGSSIINIEPNNIVQDRGAPTLPPDNADIPNMYHDLETGISYFWNMDQKQWNRSTARIASDEDVLRRSELETLGVKTLDLGPFLFSGQVLERQVVSPHPSQTFFKTAGNVENTGLVVTGMIGSNAGGFYATGIFTLNTEDTSPSTALPFDFEGQPCSTSTNDGLFLVQLNEEGSQVFFLSLGITPRSGTVFSVSTLAVDEKDNVILVANVFGSVKQPFQIIDVNGSATAFYAQCTLVLKIRSDGTQEFLKISGYQVENPIEPDDPIDIPDPPAEPDDPIDIPDPIVPIEPDDPIGVPDVPDPTDAADPAVGVDSVAEDTISIGSGIVSNPLFQTKTLCITSSQGIYVAGFLPVFDSPGVLLDFEGKELALFPTDVVFVSRLTSEGTQVFFWTAAFTSQSNVALDVVDDSVYIAGVLSAEPALGLDAFDFEGERLGLKTFFGTYIARLRDDGSQVFFKTAAGAGDGKSLETSVFLETDKNNVVLTGRFDVTAGIPAVDFEGNGVTGVRGNDVFVARLDENGNQHYFITAGSANPSPSLILGDMALANDGSVYLIGQHGSGAFDFNGKEMFRIASFDLFLLKILADGTQDFVRTAGSLDDEDFGLSIDVSPDQMIYATGVLHTAMANVPRDFAGNIVRGYESADAFVAVLNAQGEQQFFAVAGSVDTELGSRVRATSKNTSGCTLISGILLTNSVDATFDFFGQRVSIPESDFNGDLAFSTFIAALSPTSAVSVPYGLALTNTDANQQTQIVVHGDVFDGHRLGLTPNTHYYWSRPTQTIVTTPTLLFLGFTDKNNIFVVHIREL